MRLAGRQALGCPGTLIVLGLVVLAGWFFGLGLDSFAAPWAYPVFGRPTLTGHWFGTFTTPSGIRFALYLELARATDPAGGPISDEEHGELISGRANWCDDRRRSAENSPVHGSVPPFSGFQGSADRVDIQIEAGSPPPVGLLPINFEGQWRLDTLTLKPTFSFWTGSAFQSSSSNPDQSQPMTITLKRAEVDAFRSACAQ